MKLRQFVSLAELRQSHAAWDDLWERSDVTLPTSRAVCVAQWVEHFAPHGRFTALAVECEGKLAAALPLVSDSGAAGRMAAQVPRNCWTDAGDLLLDPAAADEVLPVLVDGLRRLPWAVVRADGVPAESDRWQALLRCLAKAGGRAAVRRKYHVGLIDLGAEEDWDRYQASLSRNHRAALRKTHRKLEDLGRVELEVHRGMAPEVAVELLRALGAIEDKSWKGEAGSSIVRTPGMFDFFAEQARRLAPQGEVEFTFLCLDGQRIAGEYAYVAHDVLHSHKIAYDATYRECGPFRLLRYLQLRRCFEEGRCRYVDTLGILSEANAKWSTRAYPLHRIDLSAGGLCGNWAVTGYDRVIPRVKKLLGRETKVPEPEKLGAAGYWNVSDEPEPASVRDVPQPASLC